MYDITFTICMTFYVLNMTSHPLFMTSHDFIKTSSPLYQTSNPLYLTSRPLCLCYHPTLRMISQPLYVSYHSQYTCDTLSTLFMTSYPQYMTSQHCVLLIPHSAYIWTHWHFRWHHIQSITPNHRIYVATSTLGMTSHPLYQTLPRLFLCHPNLSTDITSTICMTSHSTYVWQLFHHSRHHILSLWHQTTVSRTSHPLYLSSYPLNLGHDIHCNEDITPTVYMRPHALLKRISYPLYMTSHWLYF